MKPYITVKSFLGRLLYKLRRGLRLLRAEPVNKDSKLILKAITAYSASCLRKEVGPKILVGTHHKVLTMFMMDVFGSFAEITNRSMCVGNGMRDEIDYGADIIFDLHSEFDFTRSYDRFMGIHFRRDPRDIVISSGFYHRKSSEEWLHEPHEGFGGLTYQEYVNKMNSMEDVWLFELDHSAGKTIRNMLSWDYSRGFVELKFEDLVTEEGGQVFKQALQEWPMSACEKSLLIGLFEYYSVFGGGGKKSSHVRDPGSRQFEQHFTEKLHREFNNRFPEAVEKLGYK